MVFTCIGETMKAGYCSFLSIIFYLYADWKLLSVVSFLGALEEFLEWLVAILKNL